MSERHRILVLEDLPDNAQALREIVGSMNMDSHLVTRLDELRECLASGFKPCAALLDIQVPYEADARPHEQAGWTAIELVQAKWKDEARVPIVVVTAFRTTDAEYVWDMSKKRKVDEFCAKANIGALPGKLVQALQAVGREDHAECVRRDGGGREGAKAKKKAKGRAAKDAEVVLVLVGEPVGRGRTTLRIGQETRDMRDAAFAALLRAVEADDRESGVWLDRFELGLGSDRGMTTRIREPFRGLVPDGLDVLEGDRRKRFRLSPEVTVEKVDWAKIAKHPDPAIAAVAREALRKRGL